MPSVAAGDSASVVAMVMRGISAGLSGMAGQDDFAAGDRVTVEAEIAGRLSTLRAVVLRVHPDTLWIAVSVRDPRLAALVRGQPLHLTFSRDGGAVVATCAFLHVVAAEPERLFAVERPIDAQSVQRREHLRAADTERSVRLTSINGIRTTGLEATTLNVGTGGVLVETALFLCVGDILRIDLVLDAHDVVTLDAQVIRIEDPAPGSATEPLYKVAIRFIEPPLAEQDRIIRHLFSDQQSRPAGERKAG